MRIRKAVFPVAGLGSRFLPATKATPKEMLPIVDKPVIQYAVEEAVAAGVEMLIFITGRTKRAIEDHFDRAHELETVLARRNQAAELKLVQELVPAGVSCVYLRQPEALGLGHAVLCAERIVDEEPFFVVLADDLIHTRGPNCLQQMRAVAESRGASVLGLQRVPRADTRRYGVVAASPAGGRTHAVTRIVEKPTPDAAPSDLAVVGRYVLTPGIFRELHATGRGTGGEIQLTDGIQALLAREKVYGLEYEGQRYDCGSKLGYLQATVELGLEHPELGAEFRAWLAAHRGG